MTLPANDDFVNCELSIEELDAVAAGSFWSVVETIGKDIYNLFAPHHPTTISGTSGPVTIGGHGPIRVL